MGILLLIGCGIITKKCLEKEKSAKEIFVSIAVQVGIAIGGDIIEKELLRLWESICKFGKNFIEWFHKISAISEIDSLDKIMGTVTKLFFKLTGGISPNIEKYIKAIANYLYVTHLFETCIVIVVCLEILYLNWMNVIWFRILKAKKAIIILILINLYMFSYIWYDVKIGYSKTGKIICVLLGMAGVFIGILWGGKERFLFQEREENSITLRVDLILEKVLIVLGLFTIPMIG